MNNDIFYKNIIIKTISDIKGEDASTLLISSQKEKIQCDKRDYFEIINRLEAIFDCTLDMRYRLNYKIDVNNLIENLNKILK